MQIRPNIFRQAAVLIALCVLAIAGAALADTSPQKVPFVDRQVTTSTGTYSYEVFVPVHWDKRKQWPVILFLHGVGERGSDNRIQTNNGIRLLIAQRLDSFPCIVVCPQCQDNDYWGSPAMIEMVIAELDHSMVEFNGNPNRLYLTGLSMGGYGVWYLAQKYPTKWAAIAPCCGGIVWPDLPELRDVLPSRINIPGAPPATLSLPAIPGATPGPTLPAITDPYVLAARTVAKIPTWIFHGEADTVVPVSESRQMAAILLYMKDDVRYTEYAGVGHNSWDYAYKETNLLSWFLGHKLK